MSDSILKPGKQLKSHLSASFHCLWQGKSNFQKNSLKEAGNDINE
ncbi:hypothetical protein T01_9648 [Trichinella spiralis]|uniref:Uncharacterized protein n=1 Tax=Trichinella spiralis TaxID=6334 RepID=A0A0V1B605_TRISP|nr:hypothetical protein T01_9648 [Trichinella spiralis]